MSFVAHLWFSFNLPLPAVILQVESATHHDSSIYRRNANRPQHLVLCLELKVQSIDSSVTRSRHYVGLTLLTA